MFTLSVLEVPPGVALMVVLPAVSCTLVPVTRPLAESGVPRLQLLETKELTMPVVGNCPVELAVPSVSARETAPVLGPESEPV